MIARGLLPLGGTVFAAFVLSVGCSDGERQLPVADGPLNVVLIVVDTLRADHLGLHGYGKPTSPNLDEFAQDAVVFTNVTAQAPWTTPSVASLFSSLYPSAHGIVYRRTASLIGRLADAHETLAEVLAQAGWATIGVTANPWLAPDTGMAQGFDSYRLLPGAKSPARVVNRIAIEQLGADSRRPFFLYLHYMDVHGPYLAPARFKRQFRPTRATEPIPAEALSVLPEYLRLESARSLADYVGAYDAGIRYWDKRFARLLEQLESRGFLDQTLVIVTSDHGEEFFEHGGFNHGRTLYQEQVHVPLILWSRALDLGPKRIDHPVALIDVAPTVLGLLGIRAPAAFQGVDRRSSMVRGRAEAGPVFTEAAVAMGGFQLRTGSLRAVRSGDWKAVENLKSGELLVFDLAQDPTELGRAPNSTDERQAGELFEIWSRENQRIAEAVETEAIRIDPETRDRLEAIGYLDAP